MRDDARYANVQVWEWNGEGEEPSFQTEELDFEFVEPVTRSYK